MERRNLGRTRIEAPVIGMGTWRTFDTSDDRSALVTAAMEAGIDLFDSSPMYGRAEDALARAVEGRREKLIIATKVWTPDEAEGRRQAERALGLFGHVDIYQVHNLVNLPAQLALLESLKEQGKVTAIGATHYQEPAFDELMALMSSGRLDMVQVPYNPLRRAAESRLLPLAQSLGLGVLVMSPLQHGILERRPTAGEMKELGVETWAQAVLKWIASDPRVTTVLTATQHPERVVENSRGGTAPFFDSDQRELVVRIAERTPRPT
ncbi:MAG TPA: aldo/keto reductase [Candidatus Dormibacteraeota bacterium]|nr:aldo/keto reductase [Candidatus Dormibacteraeota bacterium]